MQIIPLKELNELENGLLEQAYDAAKKTAPSSTCMVGAAILSNKGKIFCGATVLRTRAIGSTCSERMALDQLYFEGDQVPITICTIGTFSRPGWQDDYLCTPCGVCLEMFLEATKFFNVHDIDFICSSWDKSKIIKTSLNELFPQISKGNWTR